MSWLKNLTFPLRATLVTSVIISALMTTVIIIGCAGIPAYLNVQQSIRNLWKELTKQEAQAATEQILSYFQGAPLTIGLVERLISQETFGTLGVEKILDIAYQTLKQNPQMVTVYYCKEDGSFCGVFKIGDGFLGSYRTIGADGKTAVKNYHRGATNTWTVTGEEISDYDPRKRPFWKVGIDHPTGGWTDPYRFVTTGATGYSFVLAQKSPAELRGFWGVDYQIDHLSDYLKSFSVGNEGTIDIIAENGTRIAELYPQRLKNRLLPEIWNEYIRTKTETLFIEIEDQIFYIYPFPPEVGIPWNMVFSIHKNDFLLPIRNNALRSLLIGFIPCFLFLVIAGLYFGHISRRLKQIALEMDEVGNLSIQVYPRDTSHSRIQEINMMNRSLYKMKIGLQSFLKYVPVDLVKKLLHLSKSPELGGEKREMTILFADLTQFSSLAEELPPDEITALLKKFLSLVSGEVAREKGIIDKFMGDAAMALWGAPDPMADHALAACQTALFLKRATAGDAQMKHKIGINTGMVVVGNFGSEERMDYTAIGDVVNIAARLEKLNSKYETQILMGEATAQEAEKKFLIRPVDWVVLKGRKQSSLIYELLEEKGKVSESLNRAVSTYKLALNSYQHRQFTEAKALFNKAKTLFGNHDVPSTILAHRCQLFEQNPPPKDWNFAALPTDP